MPELPTSACSSASSCASDSAPRTRGWSRHADVVLPEQRLLVEARLELRDEAEREFGLALLQHAASGFMLDEADTCCARPFAAVRLVKRSADAPAFLFVADESPLHRKLGIHEVRG